MDDKKIKVTVVEQRGSGGMIHYAYQMCTAFANEGAEVELVTAREYELEHFPHNFKVSRLMNLWPLTDPLLSKTPRNKMEAIARKVFWNTRRGVRAIRLIAQWVKLTNYIIKTKPDVTQFGETEFPFEALFLQQLRWHRLVISTICHEFESRDERNFLALLKSRLNALAFESFALIFLHGESNRKKFLSMYDIPAKRTHVIVHGNEQIFPIPQNLNEIAQKLRTQYHLEDEHRVILFFGTITPSKGVDDLLRAFAQVHAQNANARLVIAGMPTKHMNMTLLIQLINDLDLHDSVVFDSRYLPMEEIAPLMSLAHVVAYPYINSSQSGALQVAYTFGKAVVATNVGGLADDVEEGKSGYLVPPQSPRDFAQALTQIIDYPDISQKMGAYAKHLSETHFAWEPIARSILDVYKNIQEGNAS